jgi:hypothetical protein
MLAQTPAFIPFLSRFCPVFVPSAADFSGYNDNVCGWRPIEENEILLILSIPSKYRRDIGRYRRVIGGLSEGYRRMIARVIGVFPSDFKRESPRFSSKHPLNKKKTSGSLSAITSAAPKLTELTAYKPGKQTDKSEKNQTRPIRPIGPIRPLH